MSNYDITFCNNTNCKKYGCKRHQFGIPKDLIKLVSIGNFPNCEYWRDEDE